MNRKQFTRGAIVALSLIGLLSSGCVRMPTEKQSIVDDRPSISFSVAQDKSHYLSAEVSLDGAFVGQVSRYIQGASVLRVLPGTHKIEVRHQGSAVLSEEFYLSSGTSRSFVLN